MTSESAGALLPPPLALHTYARDGDVQRLILCLSRGDNINAQNPDAWFHHGPKMDTPLHVCCRMNNVEVAKILVQQGADIGAKNAAGQTPLDLCTPELTAELQRASGLGACVAGGGGLSTSSAASPSSQQLVPPPEVSATSAELVASSERSAGATPSPSPQQQQQQQQQQPVAMGAAQTPLEQTTSIMRFGLPLGRAVPQGANMPVLLDHALQFLSSPQQQPIPSDLFSAVSVDDPRVAQLKTAFEVLDPCTQPSPLATDQQQQQQSVHVVAALMLAYLRALPHPIVPLKLYGVAMQVAQVGPLRAALAQTRILVYKLPPISRQIIFTLCSFLRGSGIPSASTAPEFARFFLRPTMQYEPEPEPPPPGARPTPTPADQAAIVFTSWLIDHCDYITLAIDEPVLDPQAAAQQPTFADFVLEGVALYDFAGGRETTLPFRKGQRIVLINLHRNDWIEGMINAARGFLPSSYIDIVATEQPVSAEPQLPTVEQPQPQLAIPPAEQQPATESGATGSSSPHQQVRVVEVEGFVDPTYTRKPESTPSPAAAAAVAAAAAAATTPSAAAAHEERAEVDDKHKKKDEKKKSSGFKHLGALLGRKKKSSEEDKPAAPSPSPTAAAAQAAATAQPIPIVPQKGPKGHATLASPPTGQLPTPTAQAPVAAAGTTPTGAATSPSPTVGRSAVTQQMQVTGHMRQQGRYPGNGGQQQQQQMMMLNPMVPRSRHTPVGVMPGMQMGRGLLPSGWIEAVDPRGRTYYINLVSKTSQWERPVMPAQMGMMQQQQQQPSGAMAATAVSPGVGAMQGMGMGGQMGMGMGGQMGMGMGMGMGGQMGMSTSPMSGSSGGGGVTATPGTPEYELQMRLEQLHLAEEQFAQQQAQIQRRMQIQQSIFARKAAELEARSKLEDMKKDTPSWQINFEELEFEQKIGEGGFGEVHRAKWRGTTVAIKTLKGSGSALNPSEVEKFSKEVTILRALHHPNLVLFLGACLTPRLCMVSEFMFGGSLYDLLYKKKKIPDAQKRHSLTLDIARAMAYLHNSKPVIIHRDLKSLNILLDDKGEHAKVCDVGLARFKSEQHALTGAVGTFSWMCPAMLKGLPYTEKADVYSFGLVVYEMVSGKLPFAGLPPAQISLRVAVYDERPPLPSSCPSKWKELIQTCWATEEGDRPSFIDIIRTLDSMDGKK